MDVPGADEEEERTEVVGIELREVVAVDRGRIFVPVVLVVPVEVVFEVSLCT